MELASDLCALAFLAWFALVLIQAYRAEPPIARCIHCHAIFHSVAAFDGHCLGGCERQ